VIQFSCTKCDHEYRVPGEYGGKKARCKKCKNVNVIPEHRPIADFGSECYDSGAEFHEVFRELLKWERQAPAVDTGR
jgi:hypothetical protein